MLPCNFAASIIMRYGLIALSLLLTTMACTRQPPKGNAVYFGPTAVYRLTPETKELAPDQTTSKQYDASFNFHPNYNQPLHRIVAGGLQTVFLGIVVPPAPKDLAELTATDAQWTRMEVKALPKNAVMALLKDGRGAYDVRYLGLSAKSGQIHLVNLVTQDSILARSYYDADTLFKGNLLL